MLSCSCNEDYDSDWYYYPPSDFAILSTKRGRRCQSCKEIIKVGKTCLIFTRDRVAMNDIEYRIYGDGPNISMPNWYLCENCGEIYLNLTDAGFCLYPDNDLRKDLEEYWELTGFEKK